MGNITPQLINNTSKSVHRYWYNSKSTSMYKNHTTKHFIDNKYAKAYFSIIDRALSQKRTRAADTYLELHHILPKAKTMFPEFGNLRDHPWNGVLLTTREHFICHLLLVRCLNGAARYSMIYGLRRLAHGKAHSCSRNYEIARKLMKQAPHPGLGKPLSETTRKLMSQQRRGKKKSAEHRRRIGEANSKRVWTEESRRRASESASKKKLSATHRANISKATAGTNNPMAGTKWMHDPVTRQLQFVKACDVGLWLQRGLVLGWPKKSSVSTDVDQH
jgi:hypothetical protein